VGDIGPTLRKGAISGLNSCRDAEAQGEHKKAGADSLGFFAWCVGQSSDYFNCGAVSDDGAGAAGSSVLIFMGVKPGSSS
jgi:hypothetical protein